MTVPKYIVHVREVWVQSVEVEANSPEEAKQRICEGKGYTIEDRFEFSRSLEPETWTVEKVKRGNNNDAA